MIPFDSEITLWLNGVATRFPALDGAVQLVASDYLLPLAFVLVLVGLWFSGANARIRELRQRAAAIGMASLGLVNIPVMILNSVWNRPRPFVALGDEITLLFYRPTDPSSFPSNVAAVGFAVACSVWVVHRRLGYVMFGAATLLALSRICAGVSYPTGVIVGALLGIAVALATRFMFAVLEPLPALVIRLARAFCLG